jgi:hypothetical protein
VHIPFKKNQFGAYAFFPGTGPKDKRCADCMYCRDPEKKPTCNMVAAFPGRYKSGPIKSGSASCKYFRQR